MPEFIVSFSIGVEGTTEKRLRTDLSTGRAHLKTGSLESVSAIAGYVLNAQNKGYDVVMMINLNKA